MSEPRYTIDRAAVFRDAHSRFRRRRGTAHELTFSEALRRAWQAAKQRRDEVAQYHTAPVRRYVDAPFPSQIAA